jgi:transposase-like protein
LERVAAWLAQRPVVGPGLHQVGICQGLVARIQMLTARSQRGSAGSGHTLCRRVAWLAEPSRVCCRFLVRKDGDMPKTYDPEFKACAVRLVRDHLSDYRSVTAASRAVGAQLGVARETLRRWVAQAEIDQGARPGVTTAEAEEIGRLRAENKRLREANQILKAASILFAGELDSRNSRNR